MKLNVAFSDGDVGKGVAQVPSSRAQRLGLFSRAVRAQGSTL